MAFRRNRSSAAAARRKFEMRDGKPVLVKLPEINFIDDKEGKPSASRHHIGRRPIAAFWQFGWRPPDVARWTRCGFWPSVLPPSCNHQRLTTARGGLNDPRVTIVVLNSTRRGTRAKEKGWTICELEG
jgi:hypothetical protein